MGLFRRINKILGDVHEVGTKTVAPIIGKAIGVGAKRVPGVVEGGAGVINKSIKLGKEAVGKIKNGEVGRAVKSGAKKVSKTVLSDEEGYEYIGGGLASNTRNALFLDEAQRRIQVAGDTLAGAYNVAKSDKIKYFGLGKERKNIFQLVKEDDGNLLGISATKRGAVLAGSVMMMSGIPDGAKAYVEGRKGYNQDSMPTTSAPRVPAYAQNGGATGDLVFALNNLRHGGMM